LINILEEITPIFRENGLLLDIAIDGDLDSNRTLSNYDIVNKILIEQLGIQNRHFTYLMI